MGAKEEGDEETEFHSWVTSPGFKSQFSKFLKLFEPQPPCLQRGICLPYGCCKEKGGALKLLPWQWAYSSYRAGISLLKNHQLLPSSSCVLCCLWRLLGLRGNLSVCYSAILSALQISVYKTPSSLFHSGCLDFHSLPIQYYSLCQSTLCVTPILALASSA